MRILTRITISAAVAILSVVPSAGAASNISQAALAKCSKVGSVRVVKTINQKCTKVGKTLQWVNTKKSTTKATPTSANGPSVTALPASGSECATQGDQKVFTGGKMECRKISTGKLQWFKLSDSPAPPIQATGNVDSSQCQIADQRVNRTQPYAVGFPRSLEDTKNARSASIRDMVPFSMPCASRNESGTWASMSTRALPTATTSWMVSLNDMDTHASWQR